MITESAILRTPINVAGRILRFSDGEDRTYKDSSDIPPEEDCFIDSITHILDDKGNPLCGTRARLCDPAVGAVFFGETEERPHGDNNDYACQSCTRVARSRFKKGWLPKTDFSREDCHY